MNIRIKVPSSRDYLFYLYLLFVFFLPFTKVSVPIVGLYEFTFADLLIVFLFLVNVLFIKNIKDYFGVYIYSFIIFVSGVFASIVMVKDYFAFTMGVLPYAFATLVIISTLSFFSNGDHLKQFRYIRNTVYISLLFSTVPVYYQIVTGVKLDAFYDVYGWRYTFLAQNPNQFGVYMILFFFILTIINLKYFKKSLSTVFYLELIYIPVALFSGSRTATVIFAVNLLVVAFILFITTTTLRRMIIAPIVVGALLLSVPSALKLISQSGGQVNRALRVFDLLSSSDEVIADDTPSGHSMAEAKSLFLSYPIFGVGLANKPMYSEVRTEIHNTYLKFLAETGFVGFCGFLLIFTLPLLLTLFSNSSYLVKLTLILFYIMFAAMNWPHMLLRQRWVWFFMVIIFIIGRIDKNGKPDRSKLQLLN